MSQTVLVTGADGFIGRRLLTTLAQKGHSVLAGTRRGVAGGAELGDIGAARPEVPACDCVVHLAARVHQMRDRDPEPDAAFARANVDGALNVLEAAHAAGAHRFVHVSTVAVFGHPCPDGGFRPDSPLHPETPYGRSKADAEARLTERCDELGMELVTVRPPLVYGAGAKGNIVTLLKAVRWRLPLPLGLSTARRSLVNVANLADFLALCVTAPAAAGATWLIADGTDLEVRDLVRRIGQAAGITPLLVPVPLGLLRAVGRVAGGAFIERLTEPLTVDISATLDVLGWVPVMSVDAGLRETVTGTASG